jgi:putative flippase GtrA
MALIPDRLRTALRQRREAVKFVIVGGTCYLITTVVYDLLKWTVLSDHAVISLTIATIVSTIASYFLNREWSFKERGGRSRHTEMSLFVLVNVVAIVINAVPLWFARGVLHLYEPHVSRLVQEVSDFTAAMVLGTAFAMVFRLWAFRRWVFPAQRVAEQIEELTTAAMPEAELEKV